jgi:hypothetical protein
MEEGSVLDVYVNVKRDDATAVSAAAAAPWFASNRRRV